MPARALEYVKPVPRSDIAGCFQRIPRPAKDDRRPVIDIEFDEEPFAMNGRSVLFEPALAAYGGDRWLEGGEVMSCRRF